MKISDLLKGPPMRLPHDVTLSGNLLKAIHQLKPGRALRMEGEDGEDFVLLRGEDFDHVLEQANMHARTEK